MFQSSGTTGDPLRGKEIFLPGAVQPVVSAEVNLNGDAPEVGIVRPLFRTAGLGTGYCYSVSPDGQRFLVRTDPEQTNCQPLTVVQNRTAELKK